jgi:hypothetical protein
MCEAVEVKMKDTIEEMSFKLKEFESKVKKENLAEDEYALEVEAEKKKLEEELLLIRKTQNESEATILELRSQLEKAQVTLPVTINSNLFVRRN